MLSFRDRDYLVTPEGYIFVVIGNIHPSDRVIAYLKYVPDEHGRWGQGHRRYRRALEHYNIPSVIDSMRFLSANAPDYIFNSDVLEITVPAVPFDRIAKHLRSEDRLLELLESTDLDELESKALRLAEIISENSGAPIRSLGVTGSILGGIHDPVFSDIDLVVYGFDNAIRVKNLLRNMRHASSNTIRSLSGASREKWIEERVKSTSLTRQNAIDLLDRKWNIGMFDGTEFSLHPVHTESEVPESYGDEHYVPLGIVDATARVSESRESLFMPAIYEVEPVNLKGRFSDRMVDRIVSFEGLYADIAKQGETVLCKGKLERVESSSEIRHRIVVGSPEAQGTDYLLPSVSTCRR